ncbi:MAG: hypothetical protein V7609_2072 [Verrucomicrobiota bacterium]
MKTLQRFAIGFLIALALALLSSCGNMTPEQKAQWSATGNMVAQQAADLALDEAAVRLRQSRTADNK